MNEWSRDYNGSYGTSANSSNVSTSGSPFRHSSSSLAHTGTPNKIRTESNASSNSNAPGESLISFNAKSIGGITSALAKANLTSLDQQAVQMTSTSSRESSAAHSVRSFSNATSDFNSSRPPFIRQSFSDGAPVGVAQTYVGGQQQQRTNSSTGDQMNVPVSLPTTGPLSASDPRTQLYVSNLPYRIRWQDLKDLFRRAGTVLRADVSLTADNRSRGFGTVLLATEDDACRACDMFKGFNWQGRTLDVKIDRSGTLLGVGVGLSDQINPLTGNMYMNESSESLGVAPHSPLPQPGNSLMGNMGNASPTPSPLGNATGPAYGSSPSLNASHASSLMRAVPSQQQQQYGIQPQNNLAQYGSGNIPSGISPALLPFLGSSARSSISSPSQNNLSFNSQQNLSPWLHQNAAQTYLQQQRSASISAGMSGTINYGNQMMNMSGSPSFFNGNAAMMQSGQTSPFYGHQNVNARMMNQISPALQGNRSSNPSIALPQPPLNLMPGNHNSTYFGRVLFVGNLPFHCQWQDLKDLFRAAGNIQRADVALTAEGKSRGFGTVLFASPEDAQNAVRIYHGYEYSGRTLKVHFDRFAQATAPPSGALPASPSQYTGAFAAANTPMPVSNAASQQNAQQKSQQTQLPPPPQQQQQQQQQQRSPYFSQPFQSVSQGYDTAFSHQDPIGGQGLIQTGSENQDSYLSGGAQFKEAQQPIQDSSLVGQAIRNNSPFPSMFSIPTTQANFTTTTSASSSTNLAGSNDGDQSEGQDVSDATSTSVPENGLDGLKSSITSTRQEKTEEQVNDQSKKNLAITKQSKQDTIFDGNVQQDSQSRRPSRAPVGSGAHPGRIALPPQAFPIPNTVLPPYSPMHHRISVPMTPGMPGFTFHAVPETPPVHHQFLSPGLGGPFSPPLASPTYLGPATPGAPAIRPFGGGHGTIGNINPAPGAPIHFNNGASTPMAGMMQTLHNQQNFNPMFPPIGMNYQPAAQIMHTNQYTGGSDLPQTPHWSQPRPPPIQQHQQNASYNTSQRNPPLTTNTRQQESQKREGEKGGVGRNERDTTVAVQSGLSNSTGGYPFPLLESTSSKSAEMTNSEEGSINGSSSQGVTTNLDLRDIQASTGATNTEELARKIAQMSAQKALRLQQRDRVGSSSAALPSKSKENLPTKLPLELMEKAAGRRSLPEVESAGVQFKEGKEDSGQDYSLFAAMSGSALDDSVSSAGSLNSAQNVTKE